MQRKVVNFTRHYRQLVRDYRAGAISFAELDASVQGWIAHARHGDTWGLREHVFTRHPMRSPDD